MIPVPVPVQSTPFLVTDRFRDIPDQPVRQLYRDGKWAPWVPRAVRKKYAKPRDIVTEKCPFTPFGLIAQTQKREMLERVQRHYRQKDKLIPDVIRMRRDGLSWTTIADRLKINKDSARRLAQRGVAQEGRAA